MCRHKCDKLLVNTSRSSHLLITLIILDSASPIIITDLIEMLIEDSDRSRSEHKQQKRHMNLRFATRKIFGDSEAIVSLILNQTPLKYCKSFFRLLKCSQCHFQGFLKNHLPWHLVLHGCDSG